MISTSIQRPVKVSVLMPAYNRKKFVGSAIESILNQACQDFEFIIINDGSTDTTTDIIRSYRDPRIILLENAANIGVAASLNKGLSVARGEYLARMDADDISLPQRLALQVDYLTQHPEIGVVGSAVRIIDSRGKRSRIHVFPQEDSLIRWTMCFTNPLAHGALMMRRDLIMKVGGYPTTAAEDYDLWEQLSWVTAFSNLSEVLLYLRRHPDNATYSSKSRSTILSDSILISQRRIERILREEVPISMVEKFWGAPFQSSEEALQSAELICRLASVSIAELSCSGQEIHDIYHDAARRLIKILSHPNISVHYLWQIYRMAYHLDHFVMARVIIKRVGRALRDLSNYAV